jgi:hypothetical protein
MLHCLYYLVWLARQNDWSLMANELLLQLTQKQETKLLAPSTSPCGTE